MRKSKFRGKRVDTGEWVYGCLISDDGKSFIVSWVGYCGDEKYLEFANRYLEVFAYEVIPETVGQYTGVKCTNGKEIYEDDLLKNYRGDIQRVVYIKGQWACTIVKRAASVWPAQFLHCEYLQWERIGNTHDNPELLEGCE